MKKIIKIMLLIMVLLFCTQVLTYAANAELTNSRGSYQRKNSYTKAYAYKTGDTVNYTFSLGASEGLIHTLSLYIRPASDENGSTNLLGTPTRLYNYDAANERTSYPAPSHFRQQRMSTRTTPMSSSFSIICALP